MAMGYRLSGRGSIPGSRKIFFSSPECPYRLWGLPNFLSIGIGALSRRVKRPGRDSDHSPSSSAEVKNGGAIPAIFIA
jgi:hypothetical protein